MRLLPVNFRRIFRLRRWRMTLWSLIGLIMTRGRTGFISFTLMLGETLNRCALVHTRQREKSIPLGSHHRQRR